MEYPELDDIQLDYDTDTISLTSTVAEDTEGKLYIVEGILADAVFNDGVRRWLVKWEGYPFKDCTWEPIESLEGTTLVEDWETEKKEKWLCDDDYEDYIHTHVIGPHQAYKQAQDTRKQKRAKKRQKLLNQTLFPEDDQEDGQASHSHVISSDSEEEIPLASLRRMPSQSDEYVPLPNMQRTTGDDRPARETTSPLFVPEKPAVRKPPLQDSSSDESDSEAESDDYYMAQCSSEAQKRKARMAASRKPQLASSTSASTSAMATTTDRRGGATQAAQSRPSLNQSKSTSAIQGRTVKAAAMQPSVANAGAASTRARTANPNMAPPTKPGPARNVREGSVAIRRSAPNSTLGPLRGPSAPIPMVNKPVNITRRDHKNSGQLFTRLMQQHKFGKRSAEERAPDPRALEFVEIGGASRQAAGTSIGGRPSRGGGDNPYGRREYRQRYVSDDDTEDRQQEGVVVDAVKIPVSCFEWRNGSCIRGEGCRFMHVTHHPVTKKELRPSPADGSIPPKYRPVSLTCWYWMEEPSGCQYTDDECQYAHRNTGMLGKSDGSPPAPIDPAQLPKSETHWKGGTLKPKLRDPPWTCFHWLRRRKGCRNSDEECDFAHYNTGLLGIVGKKQPEMIDKSEMPLSAAAALRRGNPNGVPVEAPRQTKRAEPSHATRPETDERYSGGQFDRSNKDITCHFWACLGYCYKRVEDCQHAHHHTGVVARGPYDSPHDSILTTPGEANRTTMGRPSVAGNYYRPDYSRQAKARDISHDDDRGIMPPVDDLIKDRAAPQYSGAQPQTAEKGVTCRFWAHTGFCLKSVEECKYAHHHTGVVAKGRYDRPHHITPTTIEEASNASKGQLSVTADTYRPDYSRQAAARKTSAHYYRDNPSPADPSVGLVDPQDNIADIEAAGALSSVPETRQSVAFVPATVTAAPGSNETLSSAQRLPLELTLSLDIPPHPDISPSPHEAHIAGDAMYTPTTPGAAKGPRERISCVEMNQRIEKACGLAFTTIFSNNDPTEAFLDRRAFLLFNPDEHIEEIELLSRWLLMHHVTVYTLAVDGAWPHFVNKILRGTGSGVIFVHPNIDRFWGIEDFSHLLMMKRIRVWSVGWQMPPEFDQYDPSCEWTSPRYCCIEVFPHGGIIYITDNVFSETPIEALQIIQWFVNKVDAVRTVDYGFTDPSKYTSDTYLFWRLAVRPELVQWTYDWCIANASKIDSGDANALARLELYHLLSTCKYIEQDILTSTKAEYLDRPVDYFPIISECACTSEAYFSALQRSQDAANEAQVEMFAGTMIALRRSYRQFFVVHTAPQKVDWKAKWKNIDEVMTPAKCLRYTEEDGQRKGSRFDFFEWAFPTKEMEDAESVQFGSEEGEVENDDVGIVAMVSDITNDRRVSIGSNMSMDTSAS